MTNSDFQKILSRWLEDPMNEDIKKELETELNEDPELFASFKQLQRDFQDTATNKIPENPFFFSKLKYKMEKSGEGKVHIQRVRWSIYATAMSLSIVMGIFLGTQVESTTSTISDEELFAEELFVDDYNIDNSLLLVIEE